MSRTDLNDVIRSRMLVTGALRLMGIWLIATQVVPTLGDGLIQWWQFSSLTQQAIGFGATISMDSGLLWGALGKSTGLLVIGIILIAYARHMARRIIPVLGQHCPGCDYELGAATHARCPECGLDLSSLVHGSPMQSETPASQ